MPGWYNGQLRMTERQVQALLALDAGAELPPDCGSRTLRSLGDRGLAMPLKTGTWAITQWGQKRAACIRADRNGG